MFNKGIALLILSISLTACTKDPKGKTGNVTEEKGYATGKVIDQKGKPLAGAKILLQNTVYYASYIHGTTNENGSYKIKVEPGTWKVSATIAKDYNGQTYRMEMHPESTDPITEEGAVRNFEWKLQGKDPYNGLSYYGGLIKLRAGLNFEENWDDVELILTPEGPLIDGSQGNPIHLHRGSGHWEDNWEINDIPIGRYTVKAVLKNPGGDIPLNIQDYYAESAFMPELQLNFTPNDYELPGCSAYIAIDY